MLATFLIGLREGLEASLVVSILVAYLVRSGRPGLLPRIWAGVAVAVAVSLAFGALLTFGPRGLGEEAQEGIGGVLSVLAVVFVTWMIFWMARAARGMGGQLRGRVDAAADAAPAALVLVAVLAVGREGLETALFLWAATQSALQSGTGSTWQPLLGAALGLAVAVLLGVAIYRGALRINLTRFFTWTGTFLVVVAAGVLAYGVHDLQEAHLLPGEDTLLFDVSNVVVPGTWYATVLKGVLNFTPTPSVLQGIAWVAYLVPVMTAFLVSARRRSRPATTTGARTPGVPEQREQPATLKRA